MFRYSSSKMTWIRECLINLFLVLSIVLPLLFFPLIWLISKIIGRNKGLIDAACGGDVERIKILIDSGTDIHIRDEFGRTALHCALDDEQLEAAALLMEQGSNLQLSDELGRTPIKIIETLSPEVIMNEKEGWLRCRAFLLNVQNSAVACSRDILFSLRKPCKVPWPQAQTFDYREIVKCLFSHLLWPGQGYKVNREPLHEAASLDRVRRVQRILSKGIDVHSLDEYGRTALHCALDWQSFNAASFLMRNGADSLLKDTSGRTAIDIIRMLPPDAISSSEIGWLKMRSWLSDMGYEELAHSRDRMLGSFRDAP